MAAAAREAARRCPSGKWRYRTLWIAQVNLARIALFETDDVRRHERRAYRCDLCLGAHLTSTDELHHHRS